MREDMKSVIADTFSQMLEKEDIDKITVTKLIGECRISRQTFYYHFKDIMDVLDWTFRESMKELVHKSLEADDPVGALTTFVSYVRRHKVKLERLLYSRRWAQIEGLLVDSAASYLAEMVHYRMTDVPISYEDMEVTLRFYAYGMTGILLQYVGKPHLDEERLVLQVEKIITGRMFPGKQE